MSADVRETVQRMRGIQRSRYGGSLACNAHLDAAATWEFCVLAPGAETLLQNAIDRLGFSARAYDKVLHVARTLADLDHSELINDLHVGEAIQYRNLDRQVL
jgi:magnesium chelatase family protein